MLCGEEKNGLHCHAHQLWPGKILTTFDLQGTRMILSECEDWFAWQNGPSNQNG